MKSVGASWYICSAGSAKCINEVMCIRMDHLQQRYARAVVPEAGGGGGVAPTRLMKYLLWAVPKMYERKDSVDQCTFIKLE